MYTESQRVSGAMEEMTATACAELFAAYDLLLRPSGYSDWGQSNSVLFSAAIGFVSSQVRGTILLACEPSVVQKSCPSGGRLRDWVGELANQLIGRLKVKLLGHSIEIGVTTPIVLQGIRIQPVPKAALLPVVFNSVAGTVLVWLEAEIAADFSLPPARVPDAGENGELLLF